MLFPDAKAISLDVETTGLDFTQDQLVLVSFSDGRYVDQWRVEPAAFGILSRFLVEQVFNRKVIVHNAAFDLPFLDYHLGCGYPEDVWDTMVCEQVLNTGKGLGMSLADLSDRYLGKTLDKTLQTSFDGGELTKEQAEYAANDVLVLHNIARQQYRALKAEPGLQKIWEIEQSVIPVFCHMMRHGIKLDTEQHQFVISAAQAKMDQLEAGLVETLTPCIVNYHLQRFDAQQDELNAYLAQIATWEQEVGDEWEDYQRLFLNGKNESWKAEWRDTMADANGVAKGKKRYIKARLKQLRANYKRPAKPKLVTEPINLGSPIQLKAALEEVLGHEIENTATATLNLELSKAKDQSVVALLGDFLAWRKQQKIVTAFGEKLAEKIDDNGFIHPEYRQYGTQSGRPTANNPNLLQIPGKDAFRRCFVPEEGNLFIVCDYSQMELRELAELSQDPLMLEAFNSGVDLHTQTAQRMFGVEEPTDAQRKVAKGISYGTSYGGGAGALIRTMRKNGDLLGFREASAAIQRWRETFHVAWAWLVEQQELTLRRGYSETPFGRRRYFTEQERKENPEAVKRAGANHVLQGCNADVTKIAMATIHNELLTKGGRVVLNVYDEIVAEVPLEWATWAKGFVSGVMEGAAMQVLKTVPAAVDCVISTSWSESDELSDEAVTTMQLEARGVLVA